MSAALDLPSPAAARVHRWWAAMPQYERGHGALVGKIRQGLPPGIFLVGNAFDGVGVSDLARAAEATADQVLAHSGAPGPGRGKEPA